MSTCDGSIPEATLLDYWSGDLTAGDECDRVEEHLFTCGECSARLRDIAALGNGVATLARQGRIGGILSRSLMNRLQRDGVHVRMFSLEPGETVPCAVFPDDDLIVACLRADFSSVNEVTLSVTGPGHSPFGQYDHIPVLAPRAEVLWATSAAAVHKLPSMRLDLTLTSADGVRTTLGHYVLEHSSSSTDPDNARSR